MSLNLRPVIEKWGEGYSYGSIEHEEVVDLIDAVAWFAGTGNVCEGQISHAQYDDLERVWIQNGNAFLDYLEANDEAALCSAVAGSDEVGDLSGEQYSAYEELRGMVASWRGMIDPDDGSLRFYVD